MARNRRRKQQRRIAWPRINWRAVAFATTACAAAAAVYAVSAVVLRWPVDNVRIIGQFERVTAMQLEQALAPHLSRGFLGADLAAMRAELNSIPWVANTTVRRRWPAAIEVQIAEQVPAARWGENGLLNVEGQLFARVSTHLPAELPRLAGPEGSEARVARLFFRIAEGLAQRGMTAAALRLDRRGAWELELASGMRVRFGARELERRLARFFMALDSVVGADVARVNYLDMRYTNGFAVGWKDRPADAQRTESHADARGSSIPNA